MRTRPVTPLLATDIIVELIDRPSRPIVLVERKNTPHGWALPGGFVDVGEEVEVAAVREAREETGLQVWLQGLLGVYSDPSRDPRGHIVSIVYTAVAVGEPHADDDARTASVIDLEHLPDGLVFDHKKILDDYKRFRKTGHGPGPLDDPRGTMPDNLIAMLRTRSTKSS
jgi:8-oxo-dGTP diphosphatase